ncbi:MAG: hypothetical protein RQ728_01960 [Brevefilum sp.]|nr:hypothetical protein [Brevefilum sp.]
MSIIIGKWIQDKGQAFEGLWFEFKSDGTFEAGYEPMGIKSGGTYQIDGNHIDIDQTTQTLGMTGFFKGLFEIKNENLLMALASAPGGDHPEGLSDARIYIKEEN